MQKKKPKRKIKEVAFEYKVSPNYAVYSISGMTGGLNAYGDIVMNAFSERHPIPRKIVNALYNDGSMKELPDKTEGTQSLIRNVHFGLAVKPAIARAIARWLNEKADEFDKLMAQQLAEAEKNAKKK